MLTTADFYEDSPPQSAGNPGDLIYRLEPTSRPPGRRWLQITVKIYRETTGPPHQWIWEPGVSEMNPAMDSNSGSGIPTPRNTMPPPSRRDHPAQETAEIALEQAVSAINKHLSL